MRITWLSTNTNMRWRWSLAQQEMTVSSLLVSAPEVELFGWNIILYITVLSWYWSFSSVADQTPTPTRFLKNCEEVGLFNELASPFDHDFKKAAEDDIKKVVVVVKLPVCPVDSIYITDMSYWDYFFFFFCSYLWICHLLPRLSYATKPRNPQLHVWRHIEIVLCLIPNLLRMTTRWRLWIYCLHDCYDEWIMLLLCCW